MKPKKWVNYAACEEGKRMGGEKGGGVSNLTLKKRKDPEEEARRKGV